MHTTLFFPFVLTYNLFFADIRRFSLSRVVRKGMSSTQAANINNLPSEILVLVLQKLTNSSSRVVEKWHYGLKLLAVCRKWRALALPLVYRHVDINVLSYADMRNDNGRLVYKSILATNLEIINALGYSMYPRDLSVWVECLEPPYTQMEKVLQVLRDNRLALQRVNALEIEFISCTAEADNSPDAIALDRKLAHSMADEFVKYVPNITSFVSSPEIAVVDRQHLYFLREITKQYASQIRHLKTSSVKLQSVDCFSDSLTSLHINVGEGGAASEACINPTTLRKLVVEDVFSNSFWSFFAEKPGSTCISFTSLTSLSINSVTFPRYVYRMHRLLSEQGNDHVCQYRLLAPDLRALSFYLYPPTHDVLLSVSLPEYLDMLVVIMGKSMIIKMSKVKSNEALKSLILPGSSEITTFDQEIALANRVFNVPDLAQHLSLTIYTASDDIPTHGISWTNLSSLTIAWRINLVTIIELLGKTPNLIELEADSVDCVDYMFNFVLPSLHMMQKDEFEPLNTKLKRINLYCLIFGESQDDSISAITEYLQARIATLKQVYITTPTTQCIRMF